MNTLDYSDYPTAVTVNLLTGTATGTNGSSVNDLGHGGIKNFQNIIGSHFDDTLVGLPNSILNGNGGNDSLSGGDSNDHVNGEAGNDTLSGNDGNDHVFGIGWSGAMTEARFLSLLPCLPDGVSEIYFHPASRPSRALALTMPDYHHVEELAALLSDAVRRSIVESGIRLVTYGDLIARGPVRS